MLVILLGKMMRKVFFGQLRASEMEVQCFFNSFSLYSRNNEVFVKIYFHELIIIEIQEVNLFYKLAYNRAISVVFNFYLWNFLEYYFPFKSNHNQASLFTKPC